MLDAVLRALRNPAAAPLIEAVAKRVLASEDDFERLHWGQSEDCTTSAILVAPPPPDRIVSLGALHAVEYYTRKGNDSRPLLYRHVFGREVAKDVFRGPRPVLTVGFYERERRPEELFIARGESRYRVPTPGIDG